MKNSRLIVLILFIDALLAGCAQARASTTPVPSRSSFSPGSPAPSTPSSEPQAEPLRPGSVPGSGEQVDNEEGDRNALGLNRSISQISVPALYVHLPPQEIATGAAVVILPGGAFQRVMIDKEGHDVARWLNAQGIAGIVVKYRTGAMPDDASYIQDTQHAIRLIRSRARELNINPERIGVMGFSAGGYLAVRSMVELQTARGAPDAPDPVERLSARPDFACLVYAYIHANTETRVTSDTSPAFIVHASDDQRVPVEHSLRLYQALRQANVPAEIHLYSAGGHGFGLGIRGGPPAHWTEAFIRWLQATFPQS